MDKIREYTKGRLLLSMEDSWNVASWYGSQEVLMHSTIALDDMLAIIDGITADDICGWRNGSSFPAGLTWRWLVRV